MKRSQLNSPVGSPSFHKAMRSKQKKGLSWGNVAASSEDGVMKGTAQRRAEAKAREARSLPRPRPPPMGDEIQVTLEEADILNAQWSREMDERLREGVLRYGGAWGEISKHMNPCMCPNEELEKRWHIVKHRPIKGPWATEEDSLLKVLVEEHGSKRWSLIATQFPGRTGKQCRERWLNHLDARVRKSAWTGGEDLVLWEAQGRLGNKWSEISKLLPGRAENAVKNRFNSLITKRMAHQKGLYQANQQLCSKKGSPTKPEQGFDAGGRPRASSVTLENEKKAPIGYERIEAYDTDCDSSEDDGDVLAFPMGMEEGVLPSAFAVTGYGLNTTRIGDNNDVISGGNVMASLPPTLSEKAFVNAPADGGGRGDTNLLHSLFGPVENSGVRSPPNSSSRALRPQRPDGTVELSSNMNQGLDGVSHQQGTVTKLGNSSIKHDASSAAEGVQEGRRHQAGNRKRVGAAVPTRKAAMKIEHGAGSGGVDVRDGQASAITEAWGRVQIKAQQDAASNALTASTDVNSCNNARRAEPTTRCSSTSSLRQPSNLGSSREGFSSEEAVVRRGGREGLNPDTLSVLRTEDSVIPSPLQIDIPSPCGMQERDAPTLSCLAPYALTPINPTDGGNGQSSTEPRAINSSRRPFVVDSGKHVHRSNSEPSPRHWGHCLKTAMVTGSSMSGGVGAKGQGAVLGDAVHNMASLSLDEDSSNCWSQLKTDVPSPIGQTFGDVSPMSLILMSAGDSTEVLGTAAQGFPPGPSISAKTQTLPQSVYPLFTPFGASSPARAVGNQEEPSLHQRDFSLLREKISSGTGSYGYIGSGGIADGSAHHYHQATSIPKAACGSIRGPLGDGYREQQQQQSILGSNDHRQACCGDNHKENDEAIRGTTRGSGIRKGVGSFGVERDGGACYGDYGDNSYINGNVGDVLRSLPGTDYIQQQQQHWEEQRMVEAEDQGMESFLSPPLEGGSTVPTSFSSGWI